MEQLSYFSSGEFSRYRAECRRMARLARRVEKKQDPTIPTARDFFDRMRLVGQRQALLLKWDFGRMPTYS